MNAKELYSKRHYFYDAMIAILGHKRSLKNFFSKGNYLKPKQKILDAGCGSGAITKALIEIAGREHINGIDFYGFDLTPAILGSFIRWSEKSHKKIKLLKADVLSLQTELPSDWDSFDLIVSAGMLEYVPKSSLGEALTNLGRLLKPNGKIVIFICRNTPINKIFMESLWKAQTYSLDELKENFRQAGLNIVNTKGFQGWGFSIVAESQKYNV